MSKREILPWRQFSCLEYESFPKIGKYLVGPLDRGSFFAYLCHRLKMFCKAKSLYKDTVLVVITHSCSLADENFERDPYAEILVAARVNDNKPQKALQGRKDRRCLHLPILVKGQTIWYEFRISERLKIPREILSKTAPSLEYVIEDDDAESLKKWLAASYNAPAFPDEFNERVKPAINKLEGQLKKAPAACITGVWVVLEPEKEELLEDSAYQAQFVLTISENATDEEIKKCEKIAEKFKAELVKLGENKIELIANGVEIISEEELRVSELKKMRMLQFDYLSEREVPGGDYPSTAH